MDLFREKTIRNKKVVGSWWLVYGVSCPVLKYVDITGEAGRVDLFREKINSEQKGGWWLVFGRWCVVPITVDLETRKGAKHKPGASGISGF